MLITLKNSEAIQKLHLGQTVWTINDCDIIVSYEIVGLARIEYSLNQPFTYTVAGLNDTGTKMLDSFYLTQEEAVSVLIGKVKKDLEQAEAKLKPYLDNVNAIKERLAQLDGMLKANAKPQETKK